mmetsp:Transcript_41676/g.102834  ORF Transcript_41676/g.102834 Transcript_41676/m.102834 type:complete len:211 (+) Transcript_41676:277-909(+)
MDRRDGFAWRVFLLADSASSGGDGERRQAQVSPPCSVIGADAGGGGARTDAQPARGCARHARGLPVQPARGRARRACGWVRCWVRCCDRAPGAVRDGGVCTGHPARSAARLPGGADGGCVDCGDVRAPDDRRLAADPADVSFSPAQHRGGRSVGAGGAAPAATSDRAIRRAQTPVAPKSPPVCLQLRPYTWRRRARRRARRHWTRRPSAF